MAHASPSDFAAASTIATMPVLRASGSVGHASISRRKSGSIGPISLPTAPDSAPPALESFVFPVVFARCSSPVAPMTKTALANARLGVERSAAWCWARPSRRTGIGFFWIAVR